MTQEEPEISIVMPLYNKEGNVQRAISSVLAQTFENFELVVMNDGSTDGGPEVVLNFEDQRIRLISQENSGVSVARNRGVQEAHASLIAFLDADDEWSPGFLQTIVELKGSFPECHVFATNYLIKREGAVDRCTEINGLPEGFCRGVLKDYFVVAAQSSPPVWSSAVAVTRKAFESVGGFPKGVIAGEDLLTWARLAAYYDIAYCTTALAFYWRPTVKLVRPVRIPQNPDIVAFGLKRLLEDAPTVRTRGLRSYLALWHRMRAVVCIQLDRGSDARHELSLCADSSQWALRLSVLKIISRLPGSLPAKAYQLLTQAKIRFVNLRKNC